MENAHKEDGQNIEAGSPPAAGPAGEDELREAICNSIWSLEFHISSEQAKALECKLLTALSPLLARQTEELAQARRELDIAEESLTPLVELVEKHTLESDESFETEDVLESHYAELVKLRAERGNMAHDLKNLRDLLGCDGSDWPQLKAAVEALRTLAAKKDEALRAAAGELNLARLRATANKQPTISHGYENTFEEVSAALVLTPAHIADELATKDELFKRHTEAVAEFLNELYAIMVDPLGDKPYMEVAEAKTALLEAAKRDRELTDRLANAEAEVGRLREERDEAQSANALNCGSLQRHVKWNEELKAELAKEKQANLDHAEDWAFCGIDPTSKTTQGLVLRDENRKLKEQLTAAESRLAEADKASTRLKWLHTCTGNDKDAEGYEWGIYRVKWDAHGKLIDVQQTLSDMSDLDAARTDGGTQT